MSPGGVPMGVYVPALATHRAVYARDICSVDMARGGMPTHGGAPTGMPSAAAEIRSAACRAITPPPRHRTAPEATRIHARPAGMTSPRPSHHQMIHAVGPAGGGRGTRNPGRPSTQEEAAANALLLRDTPGGVSYIEYVPDWPEAAVYRHGHPSLPPPTLDQGGEKPSVRMQTASAAWGGMPPLDGPCDWKMPGTRVKTPRPSSALALTNRTPRSESAVRPARPMSATPRSSATPRENGGYTPGSYSCHPRDPEAKTLATTSKRPSKGAPQNTWGTASFRSRSNRELHIGKPPYQNPKAQKSPPPTKHQGAHARPRWHTIHMAQIKGSPANTTKKAPRSEDRKVPQCRAASQLWGV